MLVDQNDTSCHIIVGATGYIHPALSMARYAGGKTVVAGQS
jgi:hypothetical protein